MPSAPTMGSAGTGLIARIVGVTFKPKHEWPVIAAEPASMARVLVGCVLPLAAIQMVLSFIHMAVIGVSIPFAGSVRMPMGDSLSAALLGFVFALIGYFVLALIVFAWAPVFSGRRNLGEALKVAAYAGVPAWLGSFFVILPFGSLLGFIAALYAIYVLYLGLPVAMRAPPGKALGYTAAVILTGIVLGLIVGGLLAATGSVAGRFGGLSRPSEEARAAQGAAMTGNVLGNLLGTDDKGKAALGAAIGNLARAGQQMEQQEAAQRAAQPAPSPAEAAARQQQSAAATGNMIGGMLGTDAQGRSALGAAIGNLARAGQQAEANGTAPAGAAANAGPGPSTGAPVDPAATGAAVGGLLSALGGALGGSQRVTPVDFRNLEQILPAAVNGLPRGAVEGANKQAMGVHGSSASATYGGGGGGTVHIKIADISGVSGLLGMAESLEQTTDSQSATGFERDTSIGAYRAHEKYTNAGRHGELQVIVAKRFSVDIDGNGVDMRALEQALAQVDLGRLAAMKNDGAQK